MVFHMEKEISRISKELQEVRKDLKISREMSKEYKLKRYHALLERISQCEEVDLTPDEMISKLHRKEY